MAKQSGLHQIRGKVGEHSYYKQTGVSGGLIRSINQGMSARVKTDAAYANTRLNNQEFGAAADTASLLGKTVVPKFRPMILPFSQSKMSKEILKVAREHEVNWGQRVVTSADTARLCEILSAMSKRDASEFVSLQATFDSATSINAAAAYSAEQAALMLSLGINSITVTATVYDVATGQWVPAAQMMSTGYIGGKHSDTIMTSLAIDVAGDSNDSDINIGTFVPEANHAGHRILVFVVMPEREINGVSHILQEYCSFYAIPSPTE